MIVSNNSLHLTASMTATNIAHSGKPQIGKHNLDLQSQSSNRRLDYNSRPVSNHRQLSPLQRIYNDHSSHQTTPPRHLNLQATASPQAQASNIVFRELLGSTSTSSSRQRSQTPDASNSRHRQADVDQTTTGAYRPLLRPEFDCRTAVVDLSRDKMIQNKSIATFDDIRDLPVARVVGDPKHSEQAPDQQVRQHRRSKTQEFGYYSADTSSGQVAQRNYQINQIVQQPIAKIETRLVQNLPVPLTVKNYQTEIVSATNRAPQIQPSVKDAILRITSSNFRSLTPPSIRSSELQKQSFKNPEQAYSQYQVMNNQIIVQNSQPAKQIPIPEIDLVCASNLTFKPLDGPTREYFGAKKLDSSKKLARHSPNDCFQIRASVVHRRIAKDFNKDVEQIRSRSSSAKKSDRALTSIHSTGKIERLKIKMMPATDSTVDSDSFSKMKLDFCSHNYESVQSNVEQALGPTSTVHSSMVPPTNPGNDSRTSHSYLSNRVEAANINTEARNTLYIDNQSKYQSNDIGVHKTQRQVYDTEDFKSNESNLPQGRYYQEQRGQPVTHLLNEIQKSDE